MQQQFITWSQNISGIYIRLYGVVYILRHLVSYTAGYTSRLLTLQTKNYSLGPAERQFIVLDWSESESFTCEEILN